MRLSMLSKQSKGSPRNKFSVKVGVGLTQSQLFFKIDQNFALELPINVGILSQYGGGSRVPTKKSPKKT